METKVYSENHPQLSTTHPAGRPRTFYSQHYKMQVRFLTSETVVNWKTVSSSKLLLFLRKSWLLALARLSYTP